MKQQCLPRTRSLIVWIGTEPRRALRVATRSGFACPFTNLPEPSGLAGCRARGRNGHGAESGKVVVGLLRLILIKGTPAATGAKASPRLIYLFSAAVSPVPPRGTAMDPVKGPTRRLSLWTVYVLLVSAGIMALILLYRGQVVGDAGGSVLLAQVISSLKTLSKR
jgi:hypothetical protein